MRSCPCPKRLKADADAGVCRISKQRNVAGGPAPIGMSDILDSPLVALIEPGGRRFSFQRCEGSWNLLQPECVIPSEGHAWSYLKPVVGATQ